MRSVKARCKGMLRDPMREHTRCDSLALQFVVIRVARYAKEADAFGWDTLSAAGH